MYARIARFEGGSSEIIERAADRLRQDLAASKAGIPTDASTAALSRVVDRVLMLVDREKGSSATIVFCETEEKLREADHILQGMSPPSGEGLRTSLEMFEVALDESPSLARRAA
jgi:hypothetical protein